MIVVLAALGLAACEKVTMNTTYYILPRLQYQKDSVLWFVDGALAYTFYADTAQWAVASLADAQAGTLTNKFDGSKRGYDIRTEQGADSVLVCGPVVQEPVLMVVCDPVDGLYAWKQVPTAKNLPSVVSGMIFRLWRTDSVYVDAKWTVVNEALFNSEP